MCVCMSVCFYDITSISMLQLLITAVNRLSYLVV